MYVYMYTCTYVIYLYIYILYILYIYIMRSTWCDGTQKRKSAKRKASQRVPCSDEWSRPVVWSFDVANPWASKCIQAHCPLNGTEKVLTRDYGQWTIIHVEQDWTPKKVDRWGKPEIKTNINHPNLTLDPLELASLLVETTGLHVPKNGLQRCKSKETATSNTIYEH